MKRYIKKYQKYISINHYLSIARRQSSHMQHVYAATFAGSVTLLIAVAILYFDYGLWHEKYRRTDDVVTTSKQEQVQDDSLITVQSPGEMIGTFIKEATVKIKAIDTSGANVLKGKDVYTKENSEE